MKAKFFMVGLVMAAAVVCLSCGGNTKEKKLKEIANGVEQLENDVKNQPVPDDEVLINHVLYQISDTRKIYNHRGMETDTPDFGHDVFTYRRTLFPKENGGFEVGYMVKTTKGVTLQANKAFYFYNTLGLTDDILEIYSVSGVIRADGSIIPVRITIPTDKNPIMWKCKDSDVLTFEPLIRLDFKLSYTVKQLKDYCKAHGLKADAVPYLFFTDD